MQHHSTENSMNTSEKHFALLKSLAEGARIERDNANRSQMFIIWKSPFESVGVTYEVLAANHKEQ